jgi:hypothetical protein
VEAVPAGCTSLIEDLGQLDASFDVPSTRSSRGRLAAAHARVNRPAPPIADAAPDQPFLTGYDLDHLVTSLRLLDADAEGADWQEVARIVLEADPAKEPDRTKRMWASHLARAKWMTETGYRHLLRDSLPN